jgi:hypothetical protein
MLDIDVLVWDSQKRYWVKPIILLKQYINYQVDQTTINTDTFIKKK